MYLAVAAEARRRGKLFGGHVEQLTAIEASDAGASIIDHKQVRAGAGGMLALCIKPQGSLDRCQPVAERFRRNGTWWVPTWVLSFADNYFFTYQTATRYVANRLRDVAGKFWSDSLASGNWLRDIEIVDVPDSVQSMLSVVQRVGVPILAGTDAVQAYMRDLGMLPGFSLHAELAAYVLEGLTPLNALQSATINPAKMWHATDSLGTVATGKLADLVLLDADPLTDITNTTMIRAVVANGRYFDRVVLDSLLVEARTKTRPRVKKEP
jgi:hypothetical protein